jgi:hypothetical protein
LLADTVVSGTRTTLADLYLRINGYTRKWEDKPELKDLSFDALAGNMTLSRIQDSVLQIIYTSILEKNLTVIKPDKKLAFVKITTVSPDEQFSRIFSDKLVNAAIDFYIRTKTQRSRNNVDNLQKQADSLVALLNAKAYSLAVDQDLNQNIAKRVATIGAEKSDREKMLLSTMYGEVVRNLGAAKMVLAQETPIIQVVDTPSLPLRKIRGSKLFSMIGGAFLLGFVGCIYLIFKRGYSSALRDRQEMQRLKLK